MKYLETTTLWKLERRELCYKVRELSTLKSWKKNQLSWKGLWHWESLVQGPERWLELDCWGGLPRALMSFPTKPGFMTNEQDSYMVSMLRRGLVPNLKFCFCHIQILGNLIFELVFCKWSLQYNDVCTCPPPLFAAHEHGILVDSQWEGLLGGPEIKRRKEGKRQGRKEKQRDEKGR